MRQNITPAPAITSEINAPATNPVLFLIPHHYPPDTRAMILEKKQQIIRQIVSKSKEYSRRANDYRCRAKEIEKGDISQLVISVVCLEFGIETPKDIHRKKAEGCHYNSSDTLADAKHTSMYIFSVFLKMMHSREINKIFGCTSGAVTYGIKKIKTLQQYDRNLRTKLQNIVENLKFLWE